MSLNLRSIAVQGFGFGVLAVAAQGFVLVADQAAAPAGAPITAYGSGAYLLGQSLRPQPARARSITVSAGMVFGAATQLERVHGWEAEILLLLDEE